MSNPIPHNGFCTTPESVEDLFEWAQMFSGSERALVMLAASMTLNLAHKLVEDSKQAA
jgi:hypothetical protein